MHKLVYEGTDVTKTRKIFMSESGIPNTESDLVLVSVDDLIYEDKAENKKYVAVYVTSEKATDGNTSYKIIGKTTAGDERIIVDTSQATEDDNGTEDTDNTSAVVGTAILGKLILK